MGPPIKRKVEELPKHQNTYAELQSNENERTSNIEKVIKENQKSETGKENCDLNTTKPSSTPVDYSSPARILHIEKRLPTANENNQQLHKVQEVFVPQRDIGEEAVVVWDAGLVLAYFLEKNQETLGFSNEEKPLHVVDVGAGTGVVGLVAASLGANVTLTDLPRIIPFLEEGIKANCALFCAKNNKSRNSFIRTIPLSWGNIDDVNELCKINDKNEVKIGGTPDLIVVSDCVYFEASLAPLICTLRELAKASSHTVPILLSYEVRDYSLQKQKIKEDFFNLAKRYFSIQEIPSENLHEEYCSDDIKMTGDTMRHGQQKRAPVYEVVSGQPTWCQLYRLASETTAHLAVNSIVRAIKTEGRCTAKCEAALHQLSNHLNRELPAAIVRDVLNLCLARDRFRCHHNPTDCLALELWRVFYNKKFTDVSIINHEFAFPKTTNYPEIVQNLERLFSLISDSLPNPSCTISKLENSSIAANPGGRAQHPLKEDYCPKSSYDSTLLRTGDSVLYDILNGIDSGHDLNKKSSNTNMGMYKLTQNPPKCNAGNDAIEISCGELSKLESKKSNDNFATISSFKLELKQCEVGCFLQDRVVTCVAKIAVGLRYLEIPGLGSDELLNVIALNCKNLEVLNVAGSREQISDFGFARYVETATPEARSKLRQLDISRCMLSQHVLVIMQALTGLRDLRISTRVFDEIGYTCDGQSVVLSTNYGNGTSTNPSGMPTTTQGIFGGDGLMGLGRTALPAIESVTVENENIVQVSVNQVMAHLRHMFPNVKQLALSNCNACELHLTLTEHPTNITYMRQHIHTLELISADYFNFPRLVYPCPNLESLHIEKPTNDIFNIDAQNVPFLYGNTVPFVNLKVLRLSHISLTNLTHFLSKSSNLRSFKVTNIGRRERPRWTDERIKQILPPDSVPMLQDFHVSCLPNEGLSTVESHRYLHLTKATVQYLTENFTSLKRIAGIESWTVRGCDRESLNVLLNSERLSGKFSVISI